MQLLVFIWRGQQIADKSQTLYDDRRGPLGLAGVIVAALSLIFLVSLVDLVSTIKHHGEAPSPPPAAAPGPAASIAAVAAAAARSLFGA
jgi:hypothetical protein